MAAPGGSAPPPRKPWEGSRNATSSPSPFRPPSEDGDTAAVVESAGVSDSAGNGLANPVSSTQNGAIVGRPPMPVRPYGGAGYNNYGSNPYSMNSSYNNTYNGYNRGYGVGGSMYGTTGYGLGGSYGGGMYGNSYGGGMYGNGMYGGGMYGGGMNGGSMYGNGMYGGSYGFGPGGMGMGPMVGAGPSSNALGDPNNPFDGNNPGPPSFWQSTLQKMHWMMVVFGNIVSLIAENTQTFHVIATALYAFLDRSGMLAGFVLKLLRLWSRPRLQSKALGKPKNGGAMPIEGPKSAGNAWDNVWSGQSAG